MSILGALLAGGGAGLQSFGAEKIREDQQREAIRQKQLEREHEMKRAAIPILLEQERRRRTLGQIGEVATRNKWADLAEMAAGEDADPQTLMPLLTARNTQERQNAASKRDEEERRVRQWDQNLMAFRAGVRSGRITGELAQMGEEDAREVNWGAFLTSANQDAGIGAREQMQANSLSQAMQRLLISQGRADARQQRGFANSRDYVMDPNTPAGMALRQRKAMEYVNAAGGDPIKAYGLMQHQEPDAFSGLRMNLSQFESAAEVLKRRAQSVVPMFALPPVGKPATPDSSGVIIR